MPQRFAPTCGDKSRYWLAAGNIFTNSQASMYHRCVWYEDASQRQYRDQAQAGSLMFAYSLHPGPVRSAPLSSSLPHLDRVPSCCQLAATPYTFDLLYLLSTKYVSMPLQDFFIFFRNLIPGTAAQRQRPFDSAQSRHAKLALGQTFPEFQLLLYPHT